jgi:hypothetical protein
MAHIFRGNSGAYLLDIWQTKVTTGWPKGNSIPVGPVKKSAGLWAIVNSALVWINNYTGGGGKFCGTAVIDGKKHTQRCSQQFSFHRLPWPAQNKSRLHRYVTGCSFASWDLAPIHRWHRERDISILEWSYSVNRLPYTTNSSQISGLCLGYVLPLMWHTAQEKTTRALTSVSDLI